MHKIDVYDFDGTIYNGDSSLDFLLYAIKKKKKIIKYLPKIFIYMIFMLLGLVSTKKFKEIYFSFIKEINNIENFINEFWKQKEQKINEILIKKIEDNEESYIISASPKFLLEPYIKQIKNVKLIATEFNEEGKIVGENCKGEEKVKLLKQIDSNIVIENFYTDSLNDLPLVNISKNSYYVHKNNIEEWDTDKIKNKNINKKSSLLFYAFLVFYFVLGIQLSYNYNFINNVNFLFESDTARVINDMSNIFGSHYRLSVHPLSIIIIQPIYFIISGFTQDKMLAIILMSSVISALSVTYIYKTISLFSTSKRNNILISMCFGIAFSSVIYTAGIELYNFAAFILIIFWYFIAKKIKQKWEKSDFFILVTLGILTVSITITNYIIFLIGCFVLLISKKVNFKKLIIANILTIILVILFSYFQNQIWQNTPLVTDFVKSVSNSDKNYIDISFKFSKLKHVMKDCVVNSIIAPNIKLGKNVTNDNMIKLKEIGTYNKVAISIFFAILCVLVIKNARKNLYINIGIILSLIFNIIFHIVYGNEDCFLYSLHFLYLIFMLFGINCLTKEKSKENTFTTILLVLFLLSEIIINGKAFLNILKITSKVLEPNYYAKNFSFVNLVIASFLIIIILVVIFRLICYFIKKMKLNNSHSNKTKCFIIIFVLVILFESIFVLLQTVPKYEKIFNIKVGTKSVNSIKADNSYKEFINVYKQEVNSYLEYLTEYKKFIKKYDSTIYNGIPDTKFYFLGMGNRRKILFKGNRLIDIENGNLIEEFNIEKCLIIPNEYTILIKEKSGQYEKIYENNDGVYIETNNKKRLVEGTNVNINIYTFDTQEYKNIKKVLYSEILFNIKDSIIYPNIIVYNKPWYRDGALACMVLKQTNNTDLISDWVSSITEVYDLQNKGQKEPDNLGELLYIISTQSNKNKELINKVEKEAERLAKENPNGYYLYGKTDYSNHYRYQNMWYELGMKAIGKESKFYCDNLEDKYNSLIWWSNVKSIESSEDSNFPYLSWASYHTTKKGGTIVNNKLYPLSWEKSASEANYKKMDIINKKFVKEAISPTHVWTASEMLLFILDETGDLNIDVKTFYQ